MPLPGEGCGVQLDAVSFLVLDEADRMVDPGRFQELRSILALLPQSPTTGGVAARGGLQAPSTGEDKAEEHGSASPSTGPITRGQGRKRRQVLVFSATLAVPHALHGRLRNAALVRGRESTSGGPGARPTLESPSAEALVALTGLSPSAAIVDLTPKRIVASKVAEAAVE